MFLKKSKTIVFLSTFGSFEQNSFLSQRENKDKVQQHIKGSRIVSRNNLRNNFLLQKLILGKAFFTMSTLL